MESESMSEHTPKGLNLVSETTKCCDSCDCDENEQQKFNKLMETQSSFEE